MDLARERLIEWSLTFRLTHNMSRRRQVFPGNGLWESLFTKQTWKTTISNMNQVKSEQ